MGGRVGPPSLRACFWNLCSSRFLAPNPSTFYLVVTLLGLAAGASPSSFSFPSELPGAKKPLLARVSRSGRCPMTIPDSHLFSRTENRATNRAGEHAGTGGLGRVGDAALPRSGGALSEPRGRAGSAGWEQWGAPWRREPVVPGPPGAHAPRRRAAWPKVRRELACWGKLEQRALPSLPGRRALGCSRGTLCAETSPLVSKPMAPNSVRSRLLT